MSGGAAEGESAVAAHDGPAGAVRITVEYW